MSLASNSGSSSAAKWPPRGISVQRWTLKKRAAHSRGGCEMSFGNMANAAGTSVVTWSRAGRAVVRLRKERLSRRRERDAKIRELGRSVFDEDGRADGLKAEAKELDERITAISRELRC